MDSTICINGKPLPRTVIFDLRSTMAAYEEHVAKMNQVEIDLEALFNDVLNAVRFKYCYPSELESMAKFFVECNIDNSHIVPEDVAYLEEAIMEIGHSLYEKLCRGGFYDDHAALHHYDLHGMAPNAALVLTYEDKSDWVAF